MAPWHTRLLLHLFFLGSALVFTGTLICNQGIIVQSGKNPTEFLANWTNVFQEKCKEDYLCHDTVLILETEVKSIILASKGCLREIEQEPTIVKYTEPPGVAATSYTHFCTTDFCNNYTDPMPLTKPPERAVMDECVFVEAYAVTKPECYLVRFSQQPSALGSKASVHQDFCLAGIRNHPEGLRCPTCVSVGPCVDNLPLRRCPKFTLSCYSGTILIKGGGIWTPVDVQGCMGSINCRLLNRTHTIGPFEVTEMCDRSSLFEYFMIDCGSCIFPLFVWALGLGFLLIL